MPSPAAPPSHPWLWISGLLVLTCLAIYLWAVADAVRVAARASVLPERPTPAAAATL